MKQISKLPCRNICVYCRIISNMIYFALAALSAVIFVNGWTDAPNAVAAAVGSRSMPPKLAVGLAALFNLLGSLTVLITGGAVARSVYLIADFGTGESALRALAAGMSAVALWAVAAWYFGIPTSESHALLAGVAGSATALGGLGSLSREGWADVAVGLLLSTAPAFVLGFAAYLLISFLFRNAERRRAIPGFVALQRLGAVSGAFLHGLQDGQKFMGILMLALLFERGGVLPESFAIPLPVVFYCSSVMAAGTAVGGGRIIKRVAMDMVSLDPPRGVAADIASTVCLVFCTAAALPVSTTHARTCAVMGAGVAGKGGRLDMASVIDMLAAWILTFPACFILGYVFTKLILAWSI